MRIIRLGFDARELWSKLMRNDATNVYDRINKLKKKKISLLVTLTSAAHCRVDAAFYRYIAPLFLLSLFFLLLLIKAFCALRKFKSLQKAEGIRITTKTCAQLSTTLTKSCNRMGEL